MRYPRSGFIGQKEDSPLQPEDAYAPLDDRALDRPSWIAEPTPPPQTPRLLDRVRRCHLSPASEPRHRARLHRLGTPLHPVSRQAPSRGDRRRRADERDVATMMISTRCPKPRWPRCSESAGRPGGCAMITALSSAPSQNDAAGRSGNAAPSSSSAGTWPAATAGCLLGLGCRHGVVINVREL
jgi:hypothetical protein